MRACVATPARLEAVASSATPRATRDGSPARSARSRCLRWYTLASTGRTMPSVSPTDHKRSTPTRSRAESSLSSRTEKRSPRTRMRRPSSTSDSRIIHGEVHSLAPTAGLKHVVDEAHPLRDAPASHQLLGRSPAELQRAALGGAARRLQIGVRRLPAAAGVRERIPELALEIAPVVVREAGELQRAPPERRGAFEGERVDGLGRRGRRELGRPPGLPRLAEARTAPRDPRRRPRRARGPRGGAGGGPPRARAGPRLSRGCARGTSRPRSD